MQALRVQNTFVEFDKEEIPTPVANKFRTCPNFEADEVDEPTPVLLGSPPQAARDALPVVVAGSPHLGAGKWSTKNTFIHTQEGDAIPHQRRHRTCPAASDEAAAADDEDADDKQQLSGSADRQGARKVVPDAEAEGMDSDSSPRLPDRRGRHLFRTEDLQESLLEGSGYEPYLHPHVRRTVGSPTQAARGALPFVAAGSPHLGAGKWATKNTFIHTQEGDATPHQRRHRTCPAASDEAAAADDEDADDKQQLSGSADRQGARKVAFVPEAEAEGTNSDSPRQPDRRRRHLFRTEDLQESLLEGSGYEPFLHPQARRNVEESRPAVPPQVSLYALHYAPMAQKTSTDTGITSPTTVSPTSGPSPTSPVHVDLKLFPSGVSMGFAGPREGYGMPVSAPMHSHHMPHMFQGYPILPSPHGYHEGSAPWPHCVMHPPTMPPAYPQQSYSMPLHGPPQHATYGFSPQAAGVPSGPVPAAARPSAARQEAAAGAAHGAGKAHGGRRLRSWAHIYLHMQVEGFDLVPRIIGRGGCNMRKIAEQTGAKLRIRGRGSGHFEIDNGRGQMQEAPTPLMIAITTDKCDPPAFRTAIAMALEELRVVEARYKVHCEKNGIVHEGPCFSIGLLPDGGKDILADVIAGIPFSAQPSHSR